MFVGAPARQGADELARVNGNQGVRDARGALRRSRRHRAGTDSADPPARGPERLARGMQQDRNCVETPMQGPGVLLDGQRYQRAPGIHSARSPVVSEPDLGTCCKSVDSSVDGLLWMSIRPQHGLLRPLKAGIPPFWGSVDYRYRGPREPTDYFNRLTETRDVRKGHVVDDLGTGVADEIRAAGRRRDQCWIASEIGVVDEVSIRLCDVDQAVSVVRFMLNKTVDVG